MAIFHLFTLMLIELRESQSPSLQRWGGGKGFSLAHCQLDFSEDLTAHSDTTRRSSVIPLSLLQLDTNWPPTQHDGQQTCRHP